MSRQRQEGLLGNEHKKGFWGRMRRWEVDQKDRLPITMRAVGLALVKLILVFVTMKIMLCCH